jgi:hypothetical protein
MLINLFDVENRKAIPSQACYLIPWLKRIMDIYPDCYMQVYSYIMFTTCPDGTINPYVNLPEEDREDVIIADLKPLKFSLEDDVVIDTLKRCIKLYETPTLRIWKGAKIMLDEMAEKLKNRLTFGKDGNATDMRGIMKEIPTYTENYMKLENMLKEEQAKVKGDRIIPFHQKDGYKETKDYTNGDDTPPIEPEKKDDKKPPNNAIEENTGKEPETGPA